MLLSRLRVRLENFEGVAWRFGIWMGGGFARGASIVR
jgi:hypothetical protein